MIPRGGFPIEEEAMDLNKVLFEESFVVVINHETKSATKNPNEPWKLKGAFKVEMRGATIADLLGLAEPTLKIAKQRVRQTASLEEARKHFAGVVSFSEVGRKYTDPKVAYHAKFAGMTKEEKEEEIKRLMKL